MLAPTYTKRFEKDFRLMIKCGRNLESIKTTIRSLIADIPLEHRHRDYLLIGNFKDRCECHVEPDWLLIYRIDGEKIVFERTGTHSDLFK